jgi:hypothetical protein
MQAESCVSKPLLVKNGVGYTSDSGKEDERQICIILEVEIVRK